MNPSNARMNLEVRGVTKQFGGITALREVDLSVPSSSIVAVLGENGAGKSTLLRLLATVLVPDAGRILLDGEELLRCRLDLRRRIYFTPDVPMMFEDRTVAANLSAHALIYEVPLSGRETELEEWFSITGAAPFMRRFPGRLARGQLWKAALACAAVIQPGLWLVDEPFASGMDALGIGAWRRLARHLAERGGTVIYTTQMVEMAAGFADHVCVLRHGRVVLRENSAKVREMLAEGEDGPEKVLRGLR